MSGMPERTGIVMQNTNMQTKNKLKYLDKFFSNPFVIKYKAKLDIIKVTKQAQCNSIKEESKK